MSTFTPGYAIDTSSWEDWQHAYRFGALYIFPPPGVIEVIDALRATHDPASAAICQAHISLSEPLPGPLTVAQVDELRAVLQVIEPFPVHYGPLRTFLPYPGVCYAISPEARIQRLREALHATRAFRGAVPKRASIAPHMTIAEFISVERTEQLLRELDGNVPVGAFCCEAIEYAVPNAGFAFERVLTLPLGRPLVPDFAHA